MSKLKKFIKLNPTFTDSESVASLCQPLALLGIHYFSHVHINHSGEMAALVTNPDFTHHYLTQGYQDYDIHQLPIKQQKMMVIWDLIEREKKSKAMHDDLRQYGYGHTCTIIQEDAQGRNYYHFATYHGHTEINQVYMQNMDILERFISYFQDRVYKDKAMRKAYQNRLKLEQGVGRYQITTPIIEQSIEDFYQQTRTDRVFVGGQKYLTPAEYQCLHWLSQGKTLEETAMILGLSLRTIKAHVQASKEKLNCNSLFQLGMYFMRVAGRKD